VTWIFVLCALPVATALYAYGLYPLLLRALARPPVRPLGEARTGWPLVTVVIPAYNEEASIAATLEAVLQLDYPPDRRCVLVVSDASTDRTDAIVDEYADRGVELLRLPARSGKTAAENAAKALICGDLVINTDASVRLDPRSLKPLVAAFDDPAVGIASGRDVSLGSGGANVGESGYVGYEMRVRDLETRAGGIVGASGCYYASRAALHREIVPEALSRDFAAPLVAREHGYKSVSVPGAVCYVPRVASLRAEYRRKVRTMARGLETLWYKRHLMDPFRYGRFAWMLLSHKLARWLVPPLGALAGLALLALGLTWEPARWPVAAVVALTAGVAALGWYASPGRLPRLLAVPAYVVWGMVAGVHAWTKALRRELNPIWEPTRREPVGAASGHRPTAIG
jgi:cellulose synthase/poly-beta-1,6-N-acetylglucosamine synthase-like glycosyltransferase